MLELPTHYGTIIKTLRKYMKLTQSQLSERTGFSQNTISNHENGKRNIGVNEIETYSKGLGVPSYVVYRISDEFKERGYSPTLNDFSKFDKMYSYVRKAYYTEGDIYFSSYDMYDEAIELLELLKEEKIDVNDVSYEYVLDLYKQIVSNDLDKSTRNYETLAKNKKSNDTENEVTIEEITKFHEKYLKLMFSNLENHNDRKKALEEIEKLREETVNIGEKLRQAPNYHYDAIKSEPMYKTYLYTYPERLETHKNFILEKDNN